MQPERGFKSALTKAFRARYASQGGWYSYIPPGPGSKRGMPDLLFCVPGHDAVWVEAKAVNGSLTREQRQVINDLQRSSHRVRVVHEAASIALRTVVLADTTVRYIFTPRTSLRHEPFWNMLWS